MKRNQVFTLISIFNDEPSPRNFNKLDINKIFPLTPNAFCKLTNLKNIEILDIKSVLTENVQKKILLKLKSFEKNLEVYLSKDKEISLAGIEAARNSSHFIMSTFLTIEEIIKPFGPWAIYDGQNLKKFYDINLAVQLIFIKIHKKCYLDFTKKYSQRGKFFVKFINKLIFYYIKGKKTIWFSGNAKVYNFRKISDEIKKLDKNSVFIYCEKPDLKSPFRSLKELIKLILNFNKKSLFVGVVPIISEGKNYSSIIKYSIELSNFNIDKKLNDYISNTISNIISNSESSVDYLSKTFNFYKPKCVILHHARWDEGTNLGLSAKNTNINAYLISHGSHTMGDTSTAKYANKVLSRGMLSSELNTISVIQSPLAMATYNSQNINSKYIISNPIMWGQNNLKAPKILKKTFTILHAGTYKRLGSRLWIYETASEYLYGIKLLIEAVEKIDNVHLIVRIRDEPFECDLKAVKKLLPKTNSWKLSTTSSFSDDLRRADMLVSYSSTTIEEALSSMKPVGLLGGTSIYKHIPNPRKKINLRKALYHLNKKDLVKQIENIKNLHLNKPLQKTELKEFLWFKDNLDQKAILKKITL